MKRYLCLFLVLALFLIPIGCAKTEDPAPELGVTGWTMEDEYLLEVTDGVTYSQRIYRDEANAAHQVYVLFADPDKVTLHTGTSDNDYELMPTVRQNVQQHMEASIRDGLDVVAAVNGDFFAINSTFVPSGLSVKSGVTISLNTENRPYSAVTKDGEFLISQGNVDMIDPSTLQMAVGGSHVIVLDGAIHDVGGSDVFSTTAHPRTLAGKTAEGKIILAVIDGRQAGFSEGASLTQCAELMLSLGAETAINHDGGGSSTMILRSGGYKVVNSPSDGNLRSVFCSIQIVKK